MMRFKVVIILLFVTFFWGETVCAEGDGRYYSRAVKAARKGSIDFAYMNYRAILRGYPRSKFRESALFAEGEYYFMIPSYEEADEAFQNFLKLYPQSKAKLFALAHRLRIAQETNDLELAEEIKRQIINFKQVSLVFRDRQEYLYRSPLERRYRAVIRIDKIEFYAEGDLFAEISY